MGRILNRFSNDIYVLDVTLPQLLQSSIQVFFSVIKKSVVNVFVRLRTSVREDIHLCFKNHWSYRVSIGHIVV